VAQRAGPKPPNATELADATTCASRSLWTAPEYYLPTYLSRPPPPFVLRAFTFANSARALLWLTSLRGLYWSSVSSSPSPLRASLSTPTPVDPPVDRTMRIEKLVLHGTPSLLSPSTYQAGASTRTGLKLSSGRMTIAS
jgi:hypothetical protein